MNAERSAAAIHAYQRAQRRAGTPPTDFSSRVLQPLEVKQALEQAEALLEPGEIVQGPGEAIPALGYDETPRGVKRKMGNYRLRPRGHLPVQRFRVVIFVQTPK